MKKNENIFFSLLKISVLSIAAFAFINMGGGSNQNTTPEPQFASLEDDQTNYISQIIDEGKTTKVSDISFSGNTEIGGIKRESDSAYIELDFKDIKELTVVKRSYYSPKFGDQEFILVNIVNPKNEKISNLLFPRNIVICGKSLNANEKDFKFSWYLRDINKIVVEGSKYTVGKTNTVDKTN